MTHTPDWNVRYIVGEHTAELWFPDLSTADNLALTPHAPRSAAPCRELREDDAAVTGMDHGLRDVSVDRFVETLRDAVANLGVVQPPELRAPRAPLALWLRAVESRALAEGWKHLLGRPVVSAWNAARAVVEAARE